MRDVREMGRKVPCSPQGDGEGERRVGWLLKTTGVRDGGHWDGVKKPWDDQAWVRGYLKTTR